jgi:alpha-L-fucosidase
MTPLPFKPSLILSISLCLCATFLPTQAADIASQTNYNRDARMQWWREARFGLFIHFGLYALPAGEWQNKKIPGGGEWILNNAHIPLPDYEKLKDQFNPEKFDAKQWVQLAHQAGMRYLVITAKHHDGFCLWPTKLNADWNIAATPFKRDLLKELADACKQDGTIRFCIYYSIMDWHHQDAQSINAPNYNPPRNDPKGGYKPNPNFQRYVEDYMKPQLKELVENYDPGVIWFDGEWIPDYTDPMGRDLYTYCRTLNPKLIINNRVGKTRKGLTGLSEDKDSPGDFGTPEQQIPATGLPQGTDWESCMTMNETWGFKQSDTKWKPTQTLIRNLVDVVSKGGNYLLNVGPTAQGEIPPESTKRLQQIGQWMKTNAPSIHAATPSPFKKLYWGKATTGQDQTLYLHAFVWPNGSELIVPLTNKVTTAKLLPSENTNLTTSNEEDGLHIKNLPATPPDPLDTVIALKLEGPPQPLDQSIKQSQDGTLTLLATDCEVHATNAKLEKKGDHPYNIGYWTNVADHLTWDTTITHPGRFTITLEYSLGGPPPGSEINLEFGNTKTIAIKLDPTKDFLDFKTVPAGEIDIPPGPITITLRPTKKSGVAVMDLRRIDLKPTK